VRIICCGALERGDDGAGVLVARRLCELGVPALLESGEASGLVEALSGCDDVVLVDAVVTGAPLGTVRTWEGRPDGLLRRSGPSSHQLGLDVALDLARALGRLPRRLRIHGIEGRRFGAGEAPSPEVVAAVEEVARRIAAEAGTTGDRGPGTKSP